MVQRPAVRIALCHPPACDPTAPYLAVPMLTGFLRAHGVEVLPIDANVEAFDSLLRPAPLASLRDRIEGRISKLERRPSLDHPAQLAWRALWGARGDAWAVPGGIEEATAILRDPERFHDPAHYARAVDTVDAALRVISAAHAPLEVDFTSFRTPFALTSMEEIEADAAERDPFDAWTREALIPRLRDARPDAVGLSVCFPGQLQPAYALAIKLKRALPECHLTVGGPGMTQLLVRLRGEALRRALGPFDSAVVYEGEHALLGLCRALDEQRPIADLPNVVHRDPLVGAKVVAAAASEDLALLPAPDFAGLPVGKYRSPHLVLPYDPTRGCYWGKCTFCHYGLAEAGTARYRERPVAAMVEHLSALSARWGTRYFYLSQDSVAPKTLVGFAQALTDAGLDLRWATDLKAEKYLTRERAQILRTGGAVACALGVESGAQRVLTLIDKGPPPSVVREAARNLAAAGVAVEAMCFTGFPTETAAEAMETLRLLDELRDDLAAFIVGEFHLTHGARVAEDPARFGLAETWQLDGDQLGLGLFFREARPAMHAGDAERIDRALDRLAAGWRLRRYPWAGSLSTAHTVLYYARFGRGVFRELSRVEDPGGVIGARPATAVARFDLAEAEEALEREQAIWQHLVQERRHVSRAAWRALAARQPSIGPRPGRWRFCAGEPPTPSAKRVRGRRPSGAPNGTG